MTYRDIIELWPTTAAFAREVGVPRERANSWKIRNSIRAKYHAAILLAAQRRALSDARFLIVTDEVLNQAAASSGPFVVARAA